MRSDKIQQFGEFMEKIENCQEFSRQHAVAYTMLLAALSEVSNHEMNEAVNSCVDGVHVVKLTLNGVEIPFTAIVEKMNTIHESEVENRALEMFQTVLSDFRSTVSDLTDNLTKIVEKRFPNSTRPESW